MRYSIKNSLLVLMVLFISSTLFAQRGQDKFSSEDRATRMTDHLTRTLDLNAAQAKRVKSIHIKYAEKMKAIRSKEGAKSEKRTTIQEMRSDLDKEMKAVLNNEQYEKLKSMPKKGMKSRHGYRGGKKHKTSSKAFKEKAKPILLDQRVKLESKITAADKAILTQIRQDIKAKKAERKELRKQNKSKGIRPGDEANKKPRLDRKNNPNFQKLKTLAEKYQGDIELLFEEIKPQLKTLKEEMKPAKKEHHSKSRKSFEQDEKKSKEAKKEKKHLKRYARFLLLDPTEPVRE